MTANPGVGGIVVNGRDVTERREAEKVLRESEERYRTLYEDNPSMYFTLDEAGTVLSVNRFGARQLGYEPAELVGGSVLNVFYEGDEQAAMGHLAECLRSTSEVTTQWEIRKVRKDGSVMWVRENARAYDSGANSFVVKPTDFGTLVEVMRTMEGYWTRTVTLPPGGERGRMSTLYEALPNGPGKELLRVLLVEDDEDDYVIIRELLFEVEGLELEWVSSYEAALGTVGREEHDVCLVDYRLGGRSGLDLLHAPTSTSNGMPMILLTGQGDRELDLEAMQAGAADYLVKGQIDAPLLERSIRYAFAQALKVLSESERHFRTLVQNGSDIITVLDFKGSILYQSPSAERVLGYAPEEMVGGVAFEYVHPDDAGMVRELFAKILEVPGIHAPAEFRIRHADGTWRTMETVANNSMSEPDVGGIVLNSRDVTDRKALEERLVYQAFHDVLTDLPNRNLFMTRLGWALDRMRRGDGKIAVLFMDLDSFRLVNESLGHGAGDAALVEVAARIKRCLRPGDLAARFGGDEFTVLLEDVTGEDEATGIAGRIVEALEASFELGGRQVSFFASIGAVLGTASGLQDAAGLLRAADVALHRAKEVQKGGYAVFDAAMNARALERLDLEADLRRAVKREKFVVYYQPKVDLNTGNIIGAEALVRWLSPERGIVSPVKFIPIAEETGMIRAIGR